MYTLGRNILVNNKKTKNISWKHGSTKLNAYRHDNLALVCG